MGATWKSATLFDLVALQRGFDFTKAQQDEGPFPVVSSSGITSYHAACKTDGPGVVIGRKGTLGTVFYISEPHWPHDTTLWVTDFKGNLPRFAYYFLKTLRLEQFDVGAANPSLNRNHIHGLPIRIPDTKAQRRITDVLSAYDDLIENNTKRINILEEMARSLYREWFVELRFPGHEKAKFVETAIGRVPKGWELGALGDVVTLQRGFDLPERDRCPGIIPIVSSSGVTGTHDTAKVDAPGIVTGRYGTLGEVYTTLFVKDFKGSNPYWLLYLLRSLNFSRQNVAGAVPGVNRNFLHMMRIVIPHPIVQKQFGVESDPILEQVQLLSRKTKLLSQQRDLLLPRLISGEIELPT